ncbi:MAG: hypothetical protein O3C40_16210, partial [Planctomycetota bacterium]|nr:hypothetical protein [Planctomycetota bacterium]
FILTTFLCTLQRVSYPTRCNTRYEARGDRLPRRDSHPLVIKPFPIRTFKVFVILSTGNTAGSNSVTITRS